MSEVAVEYGFGNSFVLLRDVGPRKVWPHQFGNVGVQVFTLTRIEIGAILKQLPLNSTYDSGLDLAGVDFAPLRSFVRDEDRPKTFLNILKVATGAESTEGRAKTPSISASNVITRAKSSI